MNVSAADTSASNTVRYSYYKTVREADTNVETLQEDMETFRKRVRRLRNIDAGTVSSEQLKERITNLLESYNTVLEDSGSLTDEDKNEELSECLEELDDIFTENADELKELGIKKGEDGWELNEDTFDDLETDELDDIVTTLFNGKDSFINKANLQLRYIDRAAKDAQYTKKTRKFYTTKVVTDADMASTTGIGTNIDTSL